MEKPSCSRIFFLKTAERILLLTTVTSSKMDKEPPPVLVTSLSGSDAGSLNTIQGKRRPKAIGKEHAGTLPEPLLSWHTRGIGSGRTGIVLVVKVFKQCKAYCTCANINYV